MSKKSCRTSVCLLSGSIARCDQRDGFSPQPLMLLIEILGTVLCLNIIKQLSKHCRGCVTSELYETLTSIVAEFAL